MIKKDRLSRKIRVRAKVSGTEAIPRISVFRSDKYIYAQVIDDAKAVTIVSASDKELKGTKLEKAFKVGENLAESAKTKRIKKVVFDRSGFRYHGRIKALADGARHGGLVF